MPKLDGESLVPMCVLRYLNWHWHGGTVLYF